MQRDASLDTEPDNGVWPRGQISVVVTDTWESKGFELEIGKLMIWNHGCTLIDWLKEVTWPERGKKKNLFFLVELVVLCWYDR